jgi:hypothetical protein
MSKGIIMNDIGARTVEDLKYLYDDPVLLNELKERLSENDYQKLLKAEGMTVYLINYKGELIVTLFLLVF